MEGEDEESDSPRSFQKASVYKRMIIVVAGAVMNILFGFVLMMITLLPSEAFNSTIVASFAPYSFTAVTGLEKGDEIVELNDYKINTASDFSFATYTMPVKEVDGKTLEIYKEDCLFELRNHCATLSQSITQDELNSIYEIWLEGSEKIFDAKDKETSYEIMCNYLDKINDSLKLDRVEAYPEIEEKAQRKRFVTDMTVIRNGEEVELADVHFFTYLNGETNEPALSIDFYVEPVEKTFLNLMKQTFNDTVAVTRMVWASFVGLAKGQFGINEVSGPVGLASALTDVAGESLKVSFVNAVMSIVYVMTVITINLGVVNMLPFPALDGGRFVMLLIEAIFKKRVPQRVESIINGLGLALLLLLMAAITLKDVWMLIFGG